MLVNDSLSPNSGRTGMQTGCTCLCEGSVVHDANDLKEARQAEDVKSPPPQHQIHGNRGNEVQRKPCAQVVSPDQTQLHNQNLH